MAGWAAALGAGWLVLKNRNPEVAVRHETAPLEKVN